MRRLPLLHVIAVLTALAGCRSGPPVALPNDNRIAAGHQRGDTLVFELDAQRAAWTPDIDVDTAITVFAFAARDGVPRIPGPLLRVSSGTVVEIRVRNSLADSALVVHGLRPGTPDDTLRLTPGTTRTTYFRAAQPGTYLYWGSTSGDRSEHSEARDGELAGAIVVDAAGTARDTSERIFVITTLDILPDSTRPEPRDDLFDLAINGRSWPHTETLHHAVGDTVRWRILNATANQHPMHLHGFHFTAIAKGSGAIDTLYAVADRRQAVTEYMNAGSTAQLQWVASRAGNWLFHCHINTHVTPFPLRADSLRTHESDAHDAVAHAARSMSGLVMGIEVRDPGPHAETPTDESATTRHRLIAQQSATPAAEDTAYARGYVLQRDASAPRRDSLQIPGPILLLSQGQRTAITVVNHLTEATSVHWHGMELESYYDGVAGWSGADARRAPMIAPEDSFIAIMTPPRAGTFMYHPHMDEEDQLTAGMFGAMIVLEPGARFDATTDLPFIIGDAVVSGKRGSTVNGARAFSARQFRVGSTYRLRFLNIAAASSAQARLLVDSIPLRWTPRAKDGADLPLNAATERPAVLRRIGVGETYDFIFRPAAPLRGVLEIIVDLPKSIFRIPIEVR